ncbi:MAG: dihydrodipicolinate synthase family protein [Alphaproteobacteria bacterium]|nr:dihydrodipicolinate synthase family protein [Alphaproteobacteria bacterium]
MKTPPFTGIHPMLYALFGADGRLDRAAMRRQVEACLAQGAHGLAVLGLASEVGKLSGAEKRQLLEWVGEDLARRRPLAATISGTSPTEQSELAQVAAANGADWLILQPPPDTSLGEIGLMRFFGAVMDRATLPVAIQNAPEYLGIGLGDAALLDLARNHGNFVLLKGEAPAHAIRRTILETEGRLAVFNGRGGLELPDNLRAGCAGIIPGADLCDIQVQIFEKMRGGGAADEKAAEALYRRILPLLVFLMQSLDHLLCYGKRHLARRAGLGAVHDRAPALAPDEFGLSCLARYSAEFGAIGP